jgi:hypothetical protein
MSHALPGEALCAMLSYLKTLNYEMREIRESA